MSKQKTLAQAYDSCLAEGQFRKLVQLNLEKIKALTENAKTHHQSASIIAKAIPKNAREWMDVYTLHYESLRTYAEALLLLEKIDTLNYQCLFASLLTYYPYLEFDWNFFEMSEIAKCTPSRLQSGVSIRRFLSMLKNHSPICLINHATALAGGS